MLKAITGFYAGQIYDEWDRLTGGEVVDLPDGIYLYFQDDRQDRHWYMKDLTPVLLEDVPKELRLLVLLLT